MLHPVEVLPGARRSLRRAVQCEAEILSQVWDDRPRIHRVTDLSPEGMRVAAGTRLPVDEIVVVSFTPPGWWVLGELTLFSRVARSEPRAGTMPAWMGLEFLDLRRGEREQLRQCLRGTPPPLPTSRPRHARELVWVDMLVTYEEHLGDRTNVFEVSEVVAAVEDGELAPQPLSSLLTGGRAPYRWSHAAA